MSNRNAMTTLTRWVLRHKKLVLGLWVVLALAGFAAMKPAGDALSTSFNIPGSEAFDANSRIAAVYGNGGDVAPIVPVVTLPKGTTVDSPGVAGELDRRPRQGAGSAARRARRLLRLDARPGLRLQGRPHHLRADLDPGARRGQPRTGRGPSRPGRARRHRRSADRLSTSPGSMRCAPPLPTATRAVAQAWPSRPRSRQAAPCSCWPSSSPHGWRSSRC